MSDEKTREAFEALEARFYTHMNSLAKEVREVAQTQLAHTIECTESKKAEGDRWEHWKQTFEGFAESFRGHCESDVTFQEKLRERDEQERKDRDEERDGTRKWVWGALLTVIVILASALGWLAPIALRAHG